jgi:hypothetical protein
MENRIGEALQAARRLLEEARVSRRGSATLYYAAREAFEHYLRRVGRDDPDGVREAHVLAAIATLRRSRPDYSSATDIISITDHLEQATDHRFAPLLAQLLLDDTSAGGVRSNIVLRELGARTDIEAISDDDMRMLAHHLAPCDGPTWQRLRARALQLGIVEARGFVRPQTQVDPDPERQRLVPKYFVPDPVRAVDPPRPKDPSPAAAVVLVLVAVSGLLMCFGGIAAQEGGVLCLAALLIIGGALGSIPLWGKYGTDKSAFANWQRTVAANKKAYDDGVRAANPKATDQQMDEWLNEEIDRLIALGQDRHKLDPRTLLVAPQVIVGSAGTGRLRWGGDGKLRAEINSIRVIYLTEDLLCSYEIDLELATRRIVQEKRESFSYRDVISITVETAPASPELMVRLRDTVNSVLAPQYGPGAIEQVELIQDRRFTMTLISGTRSSATIGVQWAIKGSTQNATMNWGNEDPIGIVEGEVVRSRRQQRR